MIDIIINWALVIILFYIAIEYFSFFILQKQKEYLYLFIVTFIVSTHLYFTQISKFEYSIIFIGLQPIFLNILLIKLIRFNQKKEKNIILIVTLLSCIAFFLTFLIFYSKNFYHKNIKIYNYSLAFLSQLIIFGSMFIERIKNKKFSYLDIYIVIGYLSVSIQNITHVLDKNYFIIIVSYAAKIILIANLITNILSNYKKTIKILNENIELNTTLEQKVQLRTADLEKANLQLQEENQKRIDFFINLSHETKTPLTLINNYLARYSKKVNPSEELEVIKQNINILYKNVMNFMDAERLSKDNANLNNNEVFLFSEMLQQKVILFKGIAEKKKIKIMTAIEPKIFLRADHLAIDKVVNNLLENAIKYTNENGNIQVSFSSSGENIILSVRDTGIGIPDDLKNKIFEPYYQITREKHNYQGLGMGLFITKKIIDDIGGTINVESKINEGTVFEVTFKKYIPSENDEVKNFVSYTVPVDEIQKVVLEEKKISSDKSNILLVEDNLYMLKELQMILMDKYNIYLAVNGKEAVERLLYIPEPDLIISDIMMDIMDGYEFYDVLSKNDKFVGTPFIFLSAMDCSYNKIKGLSMGAVDYITKPFSFDELQLKIESILKNNVKRKETVLKKISEYIYKSNDVENFNQKFERIYKEKFDYFDLTEKQKKILFLLIKGKDIKGISTELDISFNTARNNISELYKKTEKTRNEIVALFMG
ncbi:MAG: hypothetical protein A2Z98_15510 [Spirochaetes bacterium GWB1_27_13]|nr:MAG: hypothetical protein A2Z98_15510 [Spirochaetes bacterium GWB1_27_13]